MYETYYGFAEKPFSLTPDPKYLYRSQSHADAFDLLQYAVTRREGFVVVTGDIGTGKTTLCRALLEQIPRTTFTALVLNPFLTEEELLKRILQDFGVISRDEAKAGRLAGVSKQELVDVLYDFLLGLIPLKASAVLIIDEAQNLPPAVLEQIRILSNLETDKEKLLQIILVGQLNLQTLLRSPELRQLDQRVSIRYELAPLDREATGAYVAHRLAIAGGSASVSFTGGAIDRVFKASGGIPRLINLICDRALLAGYSVPTRRVTPEIVAHAVKNLDLQPASPSRPSWLSVSSLAMAATVVLVASLLAVGGAAAIYQRFLTRVVQASAAPAGQPVVLSLPATPRPVSSPVGERDADRHGLGVGRRLPAEAAFTVVAGAFPLDPAQGATARDISDAYALTNWLDEAGFHAYLAEVDLGSRGRWLRVLAGAYTELGAARIDEQRLRPQLPQVRVVTAEDAVRAEPSAASGVAQGSRP